MKLVMMAMAAMFIAGMAAWLILFRNYYALIWDIRHGAYKTPLIKQIIIKYINCKKLDLNIMNVKVFVEKNIENYSVYRLTFSGWEKLAKAMEGLIVMIAVVAVCIFRDMAEVRYICEMVGLLAALALHLCGWLTDTAGMHRALVVETVDYLENSGNILEQSMAYSATMDKLTGRAAAEFEKMSRRYEQIQAAVKAENNI